MKSPVLRLAILLSLAAVASLPSCGAPKATNAPCLAPVDGRFDPDFSVAGQRYRLRGTLEHSMQRDGGGAAGYVRLRARVAKWDAKCGAFVNVSPEAGAERGFSLRALADGQVFLSGGNGTAGAGASGLDGRLLDCTVEITPLANSRGSSLDVEATAVISVRSAAGPAGQRDAEVRIPLRWHATVAAGSLAVQPARQNPAPKLDW